MEGSTSLRSRTPSWLSQGAGAAKPILAAPGYAGWTLIVVFGCLVYAAFASGATSVPQESRVQGALAGAVLLGAIGIATGRLGAARSPLAWGGVTMLATFAVFSALSVSWSIAPGESWLAANRVFEYAAIVAVVLVAAPSVRRAPELSIWAFSGLVLVVALYAIGGKLFPTVSIGPVDLDHASEFARLRSPIGYWNGLGLLLVMATPGCIWVAADRDRGARLRVGALLALELLLVTAALTLSRGAVVAFLVVLAVMVGVGPERLRKLGVAGLAVLAAAPPVLFDFSRHALTTDGIAASDRSGDGALLALVLIVSMGALAAAALFAIRAEGRVAWTPQRSTLAWRVLAGAAVAVVLAGVVALAASERGLTGTVSHDWKEFRTPSLTSSGEPGRLLSSSGSNRWSWWREAAGAFSDRPVAGWGAGSFPILHNEYREYPTQVRSTHSVPLQFLAEGGLIGAGLGLGALALLGAAAVVTTRRSEGQERAARLVLLAAAAAWAVHSLYDWDWEIPAVTLPALAAAAIAASPFGGTREWLAREPKAEGEAPKPSAPALSLPIAIVGALIAVSLAASAALPAISQHLRIDAQAKAADAGSDTEALKDAADEAELAHKLNPLDEEAFFAAADLEGRLGNLDKTQELLVDVARLEPQDYRVWDRLIGLSNLRLSGIATEKRIETEPLGFTADPQRAAGTVFAAKVPAQLSPTAYGTPPPGR